MRACMRVCVRCSDDALCIYGVTLLRWCGRAPRAPYGWVKCFAWLLEKKKKKKQALVLLLTRERVRDR